MRAVNAVDVCRVCVCTVLLRGVNACLLFFFFDALTAIPSVRCVGHFLVHRYHRFLLRSRLRWQTRSCVGCEASSKGTQDREEMR